MNLQQWIDLASRGLAPESQARVQAEIEEHYRSAMEEPFASAVSILQALGDPKAANRAYKRVLVTAAESRLMFWNAFGDRHPKLTLAFFLTVALMWAPMGTLASTWVAIVLVYEGFLVILPRRSRPYTGQGLLAYRCARFVWAALFFWAMAGTVSMPTLIPVLVFFTMLEWVNTQLRRKLPPKQWPKGIYAF